MVWKLDFAPRAQRQLDKIDPENRSRILKALVRESLATITRVRSVRP